MCIRDRSSTTVDGTMRRDQVRTVTSVYPIDDATRLGCREEGLGGHDVLAGPRIGLGRNHPRGTLRITPPLVVPVAPQGAMPTPAVWGIPARIPGMGGTAE